MLAGGALDGAESFFFTILTISLDTAGAAPEGGGAPLDFMSRR